MDLDLEAIVSGGSKAATMRAMASKAINCIDRSFKHQISEAAGMHLYAAHAYLQSILLVLNDGRENET